MSKPLSPKERDEAQAFIQEVENRSIEYKHAHRLDGIVEELHTALKQGNNGAVMATGRALQVIGGDLLDLGSEEWSLQEVVKGLKEALVEEESTDTEQENA